jgi:hypothetical protein
MIPLLPRCYLSPTSRLTPRRAGHERAMISGPDSRVVAREWAVDQANPTTPPARVHSPERSHIHACPTSPDHQHGRGAKVTTTRAGAATRTNQTDERSRHEAMNNKWAGLTTRTVTETWTRRDRHGTQARQTPRVEHDGQHAGAVSGAQEGQGKRRRRPWKDEKDAMVNQPQTPLTMDLTHPRANPRVNFRARSCVTRDTFRHQ